MSKEQRAFNASLKHIRKQGCQSMNDFYQCAYFGRGGVGCAFAPMLNKKASKEKNIRKLEGHSAKFVLRRYPELVCKWARNLEEDFADSLQQCHDGISDQDFMPQFEKNMEELAKSYKLNYVKPI